MIKYKLLENGAIEVTFENGEKELFLKWEFKAFLIGYRAALQ